MADSGSMGERMHFEDNATRNGKCAESCTQGINKILLVLVVCLAIITVIVIAILIWKESSEDKRITSTTLTRKYPGYFRTEKEQLEFQKKSNIYIPVEGSVRSPLSCGLQCIPGNGTTGTTNGPVMRRRRAPDLTYNGCCESSTFFISPERRDNLNGVSREFVTLEDAQQFFQTASCNFAVGCTGCRCMMSQEINTAVVYITGETADTADDLDDTEIDIFYFEKCCKCINVGLP